MSCLSSGFPARFLFFDDNGQQRQIAPTRVIATKLGS
jgi:hypothetical protein